MDVTFGLKSATYYLDRKPNNELLHINEHCNHPPSIINQIPSIINNQISEYSCDKNLFDKPAPDYNISLKRSEFNENVIYISSPSKRQTRSRQIICFNTLYTANVKTNVYETH